MINRRPTQGRGCAFALLVSLASGILASGILASGPASRFVNAAEIVSFAGYSRCIELQNAQTRVVLCPEAGGRVLEYSLHGENGLYFDPAEQTANKVASLRPIMSAGRFDIGPEQIIPRHPTLWSGSWTGEIIGPHSARLTSDEDPATGVQLIREFQLDDKSSRLSCKQVIKNVSPDRKQWCHWSRTFARGNGICLIPLSAESRFPNKYVMYQQRGIMNFRPEDPSIRQRDGFLEIVDVPEFPKLGMDSLEGWFAYLMRTNLMFVKRFPTYPDRVYNEVAGLTISIWYPEDRRVELEPIGPREDLGPGESSSFTEVWWLIPYEFPETGRTVDLQRVKRVVQSQTEPVTE